jgi:leucyl/phenylalanyl-tRNA--protein transferase
MRAAYVELHRLGYGHSLEVWRGSGLAGGIYGVSLGRCFFAESMFHSENNASKAALAVLAATLRRLEFGFIDCQVHSPHLAAWGARAIPRRRYLELLCTGIRCRTRRGNWGDVLPASR